MKEIAYRGGVVKFFIPKNWIEKYEPDGGGMFYEDAPNTGTLRLNVITAKSPTSLGSDAAYENAAKAKNVKPSDVERLSNGNAMARWVQRSSEQGQPITLYWWHVTNAVPPEHLRIANLSYTVLTSEENSPATKKDVEFLTESIRNAKFHASLGKF